MRFAPVLVAAFPAILASCGSDPVTHGTLATGSAPMSATINGTAWSATTAAAVRAAPGAYSITGIRTTAPNYTTVLQLYNIGSIGTYPLGAGPQVFGGTAVVSNPSSGSWSTPVNGAAGTITISTLTDTRIAGTFDFTASAQSGTTAALNVTAGTFDIPVTGSAGVLPDNAGSKITATINGAAFAAGSASSSLGSGASPTLVVAGNNLERTLSISIANMTAAGTYALSATTPVRSIQITGAPGSNTATWGSQITGGSGTVTVTSVTATRIIGSFTATLAPLAGGATGNLTVSGNFNMGRL